MINCQSLTFVFEAENEDKDTWLRTQTANQKLKQNVQTQDVDVMQGLPMLHMEKLKAIHQQYWVHGRMGKTAPSLLPPMLPRGLRPRDMHRTKTETV